MTTAQLIKEQLNNRDNFINNRLLSGDSRKNMTKLLITSLVFLCTYGFLIGFNHSFLQAIVTTIKLPALFIITTLVCFPTLYFFLAILRFEINSWKLVSLFVVSISLMSICFIVFTPIALFFLITTNSYLFFKLINILIFTIGGLLSMQTFYSNLLRHVKANDGTTNKSRINNILKAWVCLYALIGSQLSYSLSPFFGDPNKAFILFTSTQRSFFADIIITIVSLFG